MKKDELLKKIELQNEKIVKVKEELEFLEIECKKKRLEIKKLNNEKNKLKIEYQEWKIENTRKIKKEKREKKEKILQEKIIQKYGTDYDHNYYSQEKEIPNDSDYYTNYIRKNIIPYND